MVTGSLPFGYVSDDNGRYAINEGQVAIVREIYDRFLAGWSCADVARDLNQRGTKTKHGGSWNKGNFQRMLPMNAIPVSICTGTFAKMAGSLRSSTVKNGLLSRAD